MSAPAAAALAVVLALAMTGCGGSSSSSSGGASTTAAGTTTTTPAGQRIFTAAGMALHFDYPADFKPVPLARDRQAAGNVAAGTHAGVAIGQYDLLTVTRYPGLKVPVTAANIGQYKATFDAEVSQVLHRKVASTVSNAGGIPLLSWPRASVFGLPVPASVQILNAFVGDDEYEIQCQATQAGLARIEAACREAIATLRAG